MRTAQIGPDLRLMYVLVYNYEILLINVVVRFIAFQAPLCEA